MTSYCTTKALQLKFCGSYSVCTFKGNHATIVFGVPTYRLSNHIPGFPEKQLLRGTSISNWFTKHVSFYQSILIISDVGFFKSLFCHIKITYFMVKMKMITVYQNFLQRLTIDTFQRNQPIILTSICINNQWEH